METPTIEKEISLSAFPEGLPVTKPQMENRADTQKIDIMNDASDLYSKTINFRSFNPRSKENLTDKESIIRLGCIVILPMFSVVDWYLGTFFMFAIAPIILYFEITAFTLYCPVKAFFSRFFRSASR